jgi:hypothetical protein
MESMRSCRERRNSEPAPFFNQVADGQIGTQNVTLTQFADASTGLIACLAFRFIVRERSTVRSLPPKDGMQKKDVQGKPFLTRLEWTPFLRQPVNP